MRAPLLPSRRSAGAIFLLVGDETNVFDAGLPELIHRRHHGAVFDVLIGLDDDDFLRLAFDAPR